MSFLNDGACSENNNHDTNAEVMHASVNNHVDMRNAIVEDHSVNKFTDNPPLIISSSSSFSD